MILENFVSACFCNPINWTYKRTCSILWSSSLILRVLFNPAQTWAPYKYVQGDSLRLRVWVRTFKCANKSTYVNKKNRVSSAHVIHWERIFLINKHRNEVHYTVSSSGYRYQVSESRKRGASFMAARTKHFTEGMKKETKQKFTSTIRLLLA